MALPEKRYSVVDQLNYKVSTAMLCLFAVLIAGKLHWGESLNCIPLNTNLTEDRFVKYAENYCARGNTYRAGFDEPLPLSAELRAQRLVVYHKWVPVVFIAMASLFLAPKLIWTPGNGDDSESPSTGSSHTQAYFAFKEAQTVNSLFQSAAFNAFLSTIYGKQYLLWGYELIKDAVTCSMHSDSYYVIFCDVHRRRNVGSVEQHTFQCVFTIDGLIEACAFCTWWWLSLLCVINIVNLIDRYRAFYKAKKGRNYGG